MTISRNFTISVLFVVIPLKEEEEAADIAADDVGFEQNDNKIWEAVKLVNNEIQNGVSVQRRRVKSPLLTTADASFSPTGAFVTSKH